MANAVTGGFNKSFWHLNFFPHVVLLCPTSGLCHQTASDQSPYRTGATWHVHTSTGVSYLLCLSAHNYSNKHRQENCVSCSALDLALLRADHFSTSMEFILLL